MAEIYLGNIKGPEGKTGPKGETGNGIKSITKTSSEGLIDTYTIEYTDGNTTTFEVKNGEVSQEQLDVVDNRSIDTRNELERVKNEVLETGTESDSYIHLEDSAMSEYQELEVDGVCKQTTTSGANQYFPSSINDFQLGTQITLNEDKSIVMPYLSQKSAFVIYKKDIPNTQKITILANGTTRYLVQPYDSDGNIIKNGLNGIGYYNETYTAYYKDNITNKQVIDLTTYSNVSYIRIGFVNNLEKEITISDILVGYGDLNDYEPYTGGQPSPNPDYPQPIETIEGSLEVTSCNKNLFDKSKYLNIIMEYDYTESNYFCKIIKLKPNTTYTGTVRGEAKENPIILINNTRKVNGYNWLDLRLGNHTKTWTTDETGNLYIGCHYTSNDEYNNRLNELEIMIEESDVATSFEEQLKTQITANIPDGEFIGKISENLKDTLKVRYNEEDGNYHLILKKGLAKIILNGNENIIHNFNDNISYRVTLVVDNLKNVDNNNNEILVKSTYFKSQTAMNSVSYPNSNIYTISAISNKRLLFVLDEKIFNDVSMFKTWLLTHNTQVYYALDTPYEVDLGIVDMPIAYDEVTNLFTDSELLPTINATYYRDFVATIKNLQVNEKELEQELIDINNRLSALETSLTSMANFESEGVE